MLRSQPESFGPWTETLPQADAFASSSFLHRILKKQRHCQLESATHSADKQDKTAPLAVEMLSTLVKTA